MSQLTLRGLDSELERYVRHMAESEHMSLNKAALRLMRRGAGLDRDGSNSNAIGRQLDDFIGSWSEEQAAEFDAAVTAFETVDPEQGI